MKFKMVHENYNVQNLEKSLDFYEKALGLTERRRKTAPDGSFIIVFIGNDASEFELELTWLADHPQKYDIGEEMTLDELFAEMDEIWSEAGNEEHKTA